MSKLVETLHPADVKDVTFRRSTSLAVNNTAISALREEAHKAKKGRARICLHSSTDQPIQEMIIALRRGAPLPPLKGPGGNKTYIVLEGDLIVKFFDSTSSLVASVSLSAQLADDTIRVLTFDSDGWHQTEATSECAVYIEVQNGPFSPNCIQWMQSREPT